MEDLRKDQYTIVWFYTLNQIWQPINYNGQILRI